MVKMKLKPGN